MSSTVRATSCSEAAGAGDIGEIGDIVGFHLRLAHGAVYRHFMETFADLELTQKQVSVLWLVDDHPDIAQAGLARRMHMDRATTMSIVRRLEERGLIRRARSPSDGRILTLTLTQAGRRVLGKAKKAVNDHEDWLKSRFTDAEVKQLIELLARIHG